MELQDLEIHTLSKELSMAVWGIYDTFDWRIKKVIGDQWITSVDSVGANIAEGFGRFHYLDKNKFNYNARGSLLEAMHWTELLYERNLLANKDFLGLKDRFSILHHKINNYINSTKRQVAK